MARNTVRFRTAPRVVDAPHARKPLIRARFVGRAPALTLAQKRQLEVEVPDDMLVQRDRFVPYVVGRISRAVSTAASALYRERLGVGINEARVVISLARRPRVIAKVLAEDTSLDKATVSRTLNVLQEERLVRYVDVSGRREFELTRAGRALHARISRVALERESLMLRGFTAHERATLIEYLLRVLRNVPRVNQHDPLSTRVRS